MGEQPTSSASHREVGNAETRQLRESLEEGGASLCTQLSRSQLSVQLSHVMEGKLLVDRECEALKVHCHELEATLHRLQRQKAQSQSEISELTKGQLQIQRELEALKLQHSKQLEERTRELTESRLQSKAQKLQHDKSEAALRRQITQLQEQMEISMPECEDDPRPPSK